MMFLLFLLPTAVYSHGRLTVPKTRLHAKLGYDTYENDPIGFQGRPMSQFVCRNDPTPNVSRTQVYAGAPMPMKWLNSAKHVGDCAVYIGYGDAIVNGVGDAKNSGKFVKIANIPDCKRFSQDKYPGTVDIELPSWLPAGNAVIRWEWYALHVRPTIEFYAQCADVVVESASTLTAADLPSYTVYPWVIPENAEIGVGYRDAYNDNAEQYVTGPPCAFPGDAPAVNNCQLTAPGTTGHVAVGLGPDTSGEVPAPVPTPMPVESPVTVPTPMPVESPVSTPTSPPTVVVPQPTPNPTASPIPAPTPAPTAAAPSPTSPPVDDGQCGTALWAKCDGRDADGSDFSGEKCCPAGAYCNWQTSWYSQCIPVESCTKVPGDQCAGEGFNDSNCCPEGHYCKATNASGYSQCAPLE